MLDISVEKTLDYLDDKKYKRLVRLLKETWGKIHNKYDDRYARDMWKEQVALNLPIMYLASIILHAFVKKNNIKNILFATRDCSHWYKIYSAMYPKDLTHYFHCSRNMFNIARTKNRPEYEKYVDKLTDNDTYHTVYVDIHGTGRRMYEYFESRGQSIPACFILSSGHTNEEKLTSGIVKMMKKGRCKFIIFKAGGGPIEMLNYDLIGTCNDYGKHGAVRAELEYSKKYVKYYHDCAQEFVEALYEYSNYDNENYDIRQVEKAIKHLYKPALTDLPIISKKIKHERTHESTMIK